MGDVARNAPEVAGFNLLAFAPDDEGCFAFEKYADLFMRMGMFLDDGIGFKVDDGQHHLLARCGGDMNSGEDGVTDQLTVSWKKEAHGGIDSNEKAHGISLPWALMFLINPRAEPNAGFCQAWNGPRRFV